MKPLLAILAFGLAAALALPAAAQAPPAVTLDAVLAQIDAAAVGFKSAQADFVSETYSRVVNETDTMKGTTWFRRAGAATDLYTDIAEPQRRYVLFAGGKIQVYQPSLDQLTVYEVGKNRNDVESFLVLGFGGRGRDLPKSYDVKLEAVETLNSVRTARLELVPRSGTARANYNRILLWIDLARGVSVQQQFFAPSGDYRLVRYSEIRLNQPVPPDAFKLKTTKKTRTINPRG